MLMTIYSGSVTGRSVPQHPPEAGKHPREDDTALDGIRALAPF
jgi:hypothetical protein